MADQEYLHSQKKQEDSIIEQAAKTSLVAGAGFLAFRYRRQIASAGVKIAGYGTSLTMSAISRLAHSENVAAVTAAARAIHHAVESQGGRPTISSMIRNRKQMMGKMEESLQMTAERIRNRSGSFPGEGQSLEIIENFYNRFRSYKWEIRAQERALMFDKIVQHLTVQAPKQVEQGLIHFLADKDDDFFLNPTRAKVQGFIEQYGGRSVPSGKAQENGLARALEFTDEIERKKFEDTLLETLEEYRDLGKIPVAERRGWVRREDPETGKLRKEKQPYFGQEGIRDLHVQGFKEDHTFEKMVQEDAWYAFQVKAQATRGYRPVTVDDAIELGLFKENELLVPGKDGSYRRSNVESRLKTLRRLDPDVGKLIVDRNLWINDAGEIVDLRRAVRAGMKMLSGIRDNTQIPFLRFNPLDLLHFTTIQSWKEAPTSYILRRGTIDPLLKGAVRHPVLQAHNQDAAVGVLSRDYLYMNNKVYDLVTGELVDQDVYLNSARFGMMPRITASIANLHNKDLRNQNFFQRLFALGGQETVSDLRRMMSMVTKFSDKEWAPNMLSIFLRRGEVPDLQETESVYKVFHNMLDTQAGPLSDRVASFLQRHVRQAYGQVEIDLTKLRTEEEIMGTLGRIREAYQDASSGLVRNEELIKEIDKFWNQYYRHPMEFVKGKRIRTDHGPVYPEMISVADQHETDLISRIEDAKRLIHRHAIEQIRYASKGRITAGSLVRSGIQSGELTKDALDEVRNLTTLTEMRKWWEDVYLNGPQAKEEALKEFRDVVRQADSPLASSLAQSALKFYPKWGVGISQEPQSYFGYVGWQIGRKARGYRYALEQFNEYVKQGDSPLKAGVKSVWDVVGQPFAGRRNLEDFTTISAFSYYFAERLDNALAKVGLGLPQHLRGSAQSILFHQFARRIVLPYVAYQQLKWLDDTTGDFFSDTIADTYVNMRLDMAWFKDLIGLNAIGKQWAGVFAGTDQIMSLPFMQALRTATFGLIGDTRSEEELRRYYESGEDPIRKGRFWGIGSNTPWMGGKIDRYEPNWYRKLKSDWQYTDTMYGSASEYWANHWVPTLTHPFAPLRHFLFDPYHWEKKHAEDRPYPITGGIPELEQIPIIGPLLDNTIGRVLKPRIKHPELEKAHRQYLQEINEYIRGQYAAGGDGGTVQFMPAGSYQLTVEEDGEGIEMIGAEDGTGGESAGGEIASGDIVVPRGAVGSAKGVNLASRAQLAALNLGLARGGSPVRSITSLDDLRDPDVVAELQDIGTMGSASGVARDVFYSISELAGIYGFSLKSLIGFDESGRGLTLEPSSRIMAYARAWWDLEMGSLDFIPFLNGAFSEIFRRYVPRDPNKQSYYNPIRNTMPDWLPGVEYFIDFKHGDPYAKIPHGEMRLPGEAYERLYKLHPDAFGKYGAFDRFRILADVAPYSEQYKFYRRIVSAMNRQGLLTEEMKEEYAEIRDQVASRKRKYLMYPRRFGNADIIKYDVTITQVLDQNTFLTKEFGSTPIKLAGVHVKSDDEEAKAFLSQYIYEGAKVTIGIDADPLFRVRDDTMRTIRAVVYAGNNEEGLPFYLSTKGQNINYMLAHRKFGAFMGMFGGKNNVSIRDDGSAVATRALYSEDQITVGKLWEFLVHDVFPNLPVAGPIFDKFLQVRSPLEQYKRLLYGKEWRPWNEPIKSWLIPMVETIAERHPILAAAQGYGIGWLIGRKRFGKFYGKYIGAAITGLMSTVRVFDEQIGKLLPGGQETWIPERRQKEREIEEYFDILKYVKYRGLYERAREIAIEREGIDVEELIREQKERGEEVKSRRRVLQTMKKWLSINKKLGYGDKEIIEERLKEVREDFKKLDEDRPAYKLGPYALLALRYHAEYTSTLYGADPNGNLVQIFRALPAKDREFFTEFLKASPEEREEILRLVPRNQRRFYQAKWGLEQDERPSLSTYFKTHYLPGPDWAGWRPDVSLDDIKVKVVQNEGLELTEFGLWQDDVKRAEQSGVKPVPIRSISSAIDVARLEKVLHGAGLKDVEVTMTVGQSSQNENYIDLTFDLIKDRTKEIIQEMNNNFSSIFG